MRVAVVHFWPSPALSMGWGWRSRPLRSSLLFPPCLSSRPPRSVARWRTTASVSPLPVRSRLPRWRWTAGEVPTGMGHPPTARMRCTLLCLLSTPPSRTSPLLSSIHRPLHSLLRVLARVACSKCVYEENFWRHGRKKPFVERIYRMWKKWNAARICFGSLYRFECQ